MIVRLHDLSARAPLMSDLSAVAALFVECDIAESGIADPTEEDVRTTWEAPGFNLKTDAWVIVTSKGPVVGYADVQHTKEGQFATFLRVHPEYCGRGIGTLLIWLVEERTRQLMRSEAPGSRVSLSVTVSVINERARSLFEREGYMPVYHFWRLVIEMEDMPAPSFEDLYQRGKLKMDLVIDKANSMDTMQVHRRTGIYVARQYQVYEKVLREGVCLKEVDASPDRQCATA